MGSDPHRTTQSLCPVCLARIPAAYAGRGEAVYLEKRCPDHGAFRTLVWQGPPRFETWRLPKIPTRPAVAGTEVDKGCPFDCGLCPDHRQRSCSVILEVTQRCNLNCPVCYADSKGGTADPDLDTLDQWFRWTRRAGGNCNIQLSGGEPTVRDDLPEIVAMGRAHGFGFIQVNTNGLRLAREPVFAAALKQAGLSSVFLQFDGVDDAVYRTLRGRPLLDEKLAAIDVCSRAGLGVVLVPTLVPGVNTQEIGAVLELAWKRFPAVRAVHFQPVSYFGRYPGTPPDSGRVTLPDVIRAIDAQTGGRLAAGQFKPPCCENALCSFHGQFLMGEDGLPTAFQEPFQPQRIPEPIPAELGAARAIASVARQWACAPGAKALDTGLPLYGGCCERPAVSDLDAFLARARARTFAVSAMAFQDAWSLDLSRVRDCCIHVLSPKGRLIPFCLYNLTSRSGQRLYRP